VSDVKQHTRVRNGRRETVRRHGREDPNRDQRKRDMFERRVLRQRQEQDHPDAYPNRRTPGEKRRRPKKTHGKRARHHFAQAWKHRRRHKGRAARHLALGCLFAGLAGGKHVGRAGRAFGRGCRSAYKGGMRRLAGQWS